MDNSLRQGTTRSAADTWERRLISLLQALEGKDVKDMLLNVGSGGGAAAAAPAAGGAGAGAADEPAAEEKKEEKEEGTSFNPPMIMPYVC
jgi:ribosomal protein L12E/L44/L45/RPP1/RPP2